jgi:DNA-binding response OmpR family regulator
MNILLIEDNRDLASNMFDFFEARGHTMDLAEDGLSGLHLAATQNYDALILDWMLPGMDGVTLCRRLRDAGITLPILMLTARDSLNDKVEGLEAGADDYVVKPFAMREVEARLQALVRRASGQGTQTVLRIADLQFDTATLRVNRGTRKVDLPPIPLRLLEVLMRRSPRVVTRQELEQAIWGDAPPDSDALRAHLHILRSAIEAEGEPPLIRTHRGIGYQLSDE